MFQAFKAEGEDEAAAAAAAAASKAKADADSLAEKTKKLEVKDAVPEVTEPSETENKNVNNYADGCKKAA